MVIRFFTVYVLVLLATTARTDAAPSQGGAEGAPAASDSKPSLGPEMEALRGQVRGILATHFKHAFNTRDNTPTEILSRCFAFGCEAEVRLESPQGRPINGITCLCWNYPCAGFAMLGYDGDRIAARVGYGYQEYPGEFLAMLAFARVPADYPVRVGKDQRNIADLVEAAKLACRQGSDMTLALVGLSYYVDEPVWENDLGERWSIDRIIEEELARPPAAATEAGMNRLLGLGYAVRRRETSGEPMENQFSRAKKFIADYHNYALKLQNSDGSWGPNFLAAKSIAKEPAEQLRATGRVLEWLAISMPDDRLQDPRMAGSVNYLARLLGGSRYRSNLHSLNTREIVSLGRALHALAVYDQRVFKPSDPDEQPAE